MGKVPSDIGAVAGAVEGSYGVDATPTVAMCLTGPPDLQHNDTFEAQEKLSPSRVEAPGARKDVDLDISMQSYVTILATSAPVEGAHHPIMIAAGLNAVTSGTGASGTTVTYSPQNNSFGSSTFYNFDYETDSADVSLTRHLGTRGDLVFNFDPSNEYLLLDFTGKALHAFNEPYTTVTNPTDPGLASFPIDLTSACYDFTIDGTNVEVQSFSLTLNNEIQTQDPLLTDCGGVSEIVISAGTPTFELVVVATTNLIANTSTDDFVRQAHAGNVDFAGVLTLQSDFNGQNLTLNMPKMRWQDMQEGEGNNDRKVWTIQGVLQEVTPGTADTFTLVQSIT